MRIILSVVDNFRERYYNVSMNKDLFAYSVKNEGDPSNYLDINNTGVTYATDKTMSGCRPNGRNDFLLIYVHSGMITINNEKKDIIMDRNHYVIYRPFQPQKYSYNACPDSEIYWLHFNGVFAERILDELGLGFYNEIKPNGMLPELFRSILDELKRKRRNYKNACNYHFLMILDILSNNSKKPVKSVSNDKKRAIKNMLITIESNIGDYYNTAQLAELCNYAPSTFIKIFKQVTGVPPITYLNDKKLENAAYLLSETDYSVSDISDMQGFRNQFYFSKLFKQKYGVAPLQYRKYGIDMHAAFNPDLNKK